MPGSWPQGRALVFCFQSGGAVFQDSILSSHTQLHFRVNLLSFVTPQGWAFTSHCGASSLGALEVNAGTHSPRLALE